MSSCNRTTGICRNMECSNCINRRFSSNDKSAYWSSRNNISPFEISIGASGSYWFNCPICDHEINLRIIHIKPDKSLPCGYCNNKQVCDDESCSYCENKTLAHHQRLANCWSDKNDISPRYVLKSTTRASYWFKCDICPHEFQSTPWDIDKGDDGKGSWCPYCCKQSKKFCNDAECMHCFKKSFASHERMRNWAPTNTDDPRYLTRGSNKPKYDFICDDGHSFSMALNSITCVTKKQWCPYCVNKTEKIMYDFLEKNYYDIETQAEFDWCINSQTGKFYRFDFHLLNSNKIIEIDGLQHFQHKQKKWQSPDIIRTNDVYKMKQAITNGFQILRLLQEDILYDRIDWKQIVVDFINNIYIDNVIYIGDLYNKHIEDMNSVSVELTIEPRNPILDLKWEELYDDLADEIKNPNKKPKERPKGLINKHTRNVWKKLYKNDHNMPWKKFKNKVSNNEYLKSLMVGNFNTELIQKIIG